jgi:DNA-binding transcriptional LysR family regulator
MGCSIPAFLDTIADLGHTHPGVEVNIHEGYSDDLQAQVLAGSLDLALIGYASGVAPGGRRASSPTSPSRPPSLPGTPSTGRN